MSLHSFHLMSVPARVGAATLLRPIEGPGREGTSDWSSSAAGGERRDFHHEFTTLRFRPLSEHGGWEGRGAYVPR